MKNFTIFTLLVLSIIIFKGETVSAQDIQKDGGPRVEVTAFARYSLIGNSSKTVPFMHANLAGLNVSYKRFSAEVSYLRNHTIQRNGISLAIGVGIYKKSLGKGFGFGSKAIIEGVALPSAKAKTISFQTVGVGVGFKKKVGKGFSCNVAIPMLAKRLQVHGVSIKYFFEIRGVLSVNYTF